MFSASRQSFPVSAAICTLLGVLFAVRYLLAPYPAEAPFSGGMPLAASLTRFYVDLPWIATLCMAVILIWTLIIVIQLSVKFTPAGNRNYLSPQIFLVAAAGCVVPAEAPAAYIAAWLLVLSVRQFALSLHKGYRFAEVFRAGFYLGLIPLLYAPAALVALVIAPAAMAIFRRSGREAVVCLTGLALPVPAAGFIHWAMGEQADFIYRELWRAWMSPLSKEFFIDLMPRLPIIVVGLVAILTLIGAGWALTHKKAIRKTQYKFVQLLSVLLCVAVASAFIPATSPTFMALIAIPAALCAPYAFAGKPSVLSTVIYTLAIVTVLALDLLLFARFPIP